MSDARLCSTVPMQYAVAEALLGDRSHQPIFRAALRARATVTARRLSAMPGMTCDLPTAGFYAMPKVDAAAGQHRPGLRPRPAARDRRPVRLRSGFGMPAEDGFFRIVFLASPEELDEIYDLMADFTARFRANSWRPTRAAGMRRDPLAYLTTELASLKAQGLYRQLRILEDEQKPQTTFDHRQVVNLSSNNYLGLTTHPRLRERALEATRRFGVGTGSVRTIAGTMAIHMELERRLAEFKQTEAVVVFQSGFAANAGTVSAILGKDDVVVSDELNHASIIDGCRLSRATIKVFPHKDVDAARKIAAALPAGAAQAPHHRRRVQHGRRPRRRCRSCATLAEEFGCIMMVDDAHASGVFGRNGRGTIDHFGVHGRVDIQVGTLSKAIGVLGGYVAGSRALIEFLYHRARPFLFSTSHPPAVAAACIAALDVLLEEPQIIDRLWDNTRFFKAGLRGARLQHRARARARSRRSSSATARWR